MKPLWPDEVESRIRAEARSLDEQQTPLEIRFCRRCVVSNQRPRIVFDEEGVCSACRYAERKNLPPAYDADGLVHGSVRSAGGIDWPMREAALIDLLKRHKRKAGYDVVAPCSGGKDSATVAHKLKHTYGMRPLCVKWAPFLYTDIGRKNLDSFIHSGFDVMVMHPNGIIHRKLARLSFEYLGDPFQPFVFGQLAYPMHMALRFNVPLVFYGENGEAEYGGDPSANDKPCWDRDDWERVYLKGAGVEKLIKIGLELGAISPQEADEASEFYSLPPLNEMEAQGVQFHWLGHYLKWHPQANYYYATEHTGFECNTERSEGTYSKYASLDDKMDGIHYYMAYVKFGIGRATSDAAHEVRDGEITREEAVALVDRYDGEVPSKHMTECQEYMGVDNNHFWKVARRFHKPHVWLHQNGSWEPRKTVAAE